MSGCAKITNIFLAEKLDGSVPTEPFLFAAICSDVTTGSGSLVQAIFHIHIFHRHSINVDNIILPYF